MMKIDRLTFAHRINLALLNDYELFIMDRTYENSTDVEIAREVNTTVRSVRKSFKVILKKLKLSNIASASIIYGLWVTEEESEV